MTTESEVSSQASLRLPMDEAKADSTLLLRYVVKSPENRKCLATEEDGTSAKLPSRCSAALPFVLRDSRAPADAGGGGEVAYLLFVALIK